MKNSIILFLFLIPAFLFAQYPTTGNKSRLGWQTTGDGLIWRGVAGDTVNKPNNRNYPYFQLDTVNAVLYRYIATQGNWQAVGGGSIDIDSLVYATRFWVNSNFFPLQGGLLTGTGGSGFVGFPLQSSPPATPSTGFSLFAGSTGNNISWMQPDGFFRRLVSPVTGTPRQYQFMARSYTLGDSADIANNVTSIAANYIATSNGTNLVARNLFDNNTYVGVLNNKPFQLGQWTTAGRPTGTLGYTGLNTSLNALDFYDGSTYTQFGLLNRTQEWTGMNTFTRTTEPLRIGYNSSNYASFVIGSQGSLGITVNGTNPDITLTATNGGAINLIPGATGAVNMYTTSAGFALRNTTGTPTFFGFYNSSSILRGLWGLTNSTNGLITGSVANDMAFRTQGGNLLFSTDSGNNSHMYIKSNGNVGIGIGQVNPQRTLHVTGEMRLTDLTTDPPTRIVGADADGDIGQITFGTGITAPSGVLTIPTWKGELEAGNNFTISASSKTTTLKGDGNVFRTTTSAGARGSLMQNGAMLVAKTTAGRFGGNFFIQDTLGVVDNLFYIGQDDDASIQAFGAGPQITHTIQNTKLPGTFRWAYALRVDTSVAIPALRIVQGDRYASTLNPVSHRFYAGLQATATISAYNFTSFAADGKMAFTVNGAFNIRQAGKIYFAPDSTFSFDPANDLLQLSQYGTGAKEAADLSKTQSSYIAGFATDGTVLDLERKRDTTIYIDDTDYDFSAAITTAQIASRYNRVIFWMTTTGAAGSDSDLTLHTPDANLMQVEYLIHSVDEAGGFSNKIVFGTNNAVDSTNGLVTNYYPAAGDGIHMRAGLRSGVYKYRYSN